MQSLIFPVFLFLSISAMAQGPSDVELQAVPGISGLNAPLGLKHASDGSGRIFIVEQGGRVWVIDSAGNLPGEPFIDISSSVTCCGERGLLDIAFHPEYSSAGADGEGLFYLHFSSDGSAIAGTDIGDTVVAEFSVSGDPDIANVEPERIILTVTQDFSNHNGGQMRFGPDGYLYLGLGDGGRGGDPCNRAQTLDPALIETSGDCKNDPSVALLGKMLRIDVDSSTQADQNTNLCGVGAGNAAEYSIPAENPFADQTDRCGEVLLYGLRNPWRWSFDRHTGDIWIGDVGQNQWEEIDLVPAPAQGTFDVAENLGWNCFEGSSTFSSGNDCPPPYPVMPVIEYARDDGNCSVTGGYRYRGFIRSLQGRYVYGDYCSGRIWFADDESGPWQSEQFESGLSWLRSFGEDEAGNLYAIAGSQLYRFIGEEIFLDGFEE